MNQTIKLEAEERTEKGTSASRRLRSSGRIPAVMYGLGKGSIEFSISEHEFKKILRQGQRIVDIDLKGEQQQAMLKEVQYNQMGDYITHVDFVRVEAGQKIQVSVAIELVGTPKGAAGDGMLDQVLREIEVECIPSAIPSGFKHNVTALDVGESVQVKDLEMPEGVVPLEDLESTVAQVVIHLEEDEEESETPEEMEMPEVIGEKKEEEGEEGEQPSEEE